MELLRYHKRQMRRGVGLLIGFIALLAGPAWADSPKPAPPVFVSGNYGVTFRSPPGAMICPLPKDWVGSDHGAVIFLSSPGECGGAGFSSGSRSFSENTPRLQIYYQLWLDDPPTPPPRCRRTAGMIKLMGKARPLCRAVASGMLTMSVSAGYQGDGFDWVEVSLITTPRRLADDMKALKTLAASLHPCRAAWANADGTHGVIGTGEDCPAAGTFF